MDDAHDLVVNTLSLVRTSVAGFSNHNLKKSFISCDIARYSTFTNIFPFVLECELGNHNFEDLSN